MNMLIPIVIAVGVFEAIAQSCLQKAQKTARRWLILVGLLCYGIVSILLYASYYYKGMGIVNAMWSGISIVLMLFLGRTLFDERVNRVEWIGVGLILIGVVIINSYNIKKSSD